MGLFGRITGAEQQQNAQRRANQVIQQGIEKGLGTVDEYGNLIRGDIQGGIDQNLSFLNQAGGMFQGGADAFNPALSNLQQTGTAGGRAQSIMDILGDPNQQAMFNMIQRDTSQGLSGLGLRRSGYGNQLSQTNKLNYANTAINQQDLSQQNIANLGGGSQQSLASILGKSGAVAGQGGLNLANQQGNQLSNILDLTGQGVKSEASSIIASGNAAAAGRQSLINAGGQVAGMMMMSDIRLKEDINKIGEMPSGLAIYSYRYKGESDLQVGLMAHEVASKFPDAVALTADGYLAVDYGMVG